MPNFKINVDFDDVIEQVSKLKGSTRQIMVALRRGMVGGAGLYGREWRGSVAALDKGDYRKSIRQAVTPVIGNKVTAIISANVVSEKGFPYPIALEIGQTRKGAVYHYRRTARRGQRTGGQVAAMVKRGRQKVVDLMVAKANEVMKRFQVK